MESAGEILSHFTYETRISSREFCHSLCKHSNFADYKKGSVVDFIESRTWFYQAWRQDPTIQSMLRMIKGTEANIKMGSNIDGLEELFATESEMKFVEYWDMLCSKNAPIVFYHQPLEDFGLSDELYVKMNARGKQLSAFENFKADLVGYLIDKSQGEENTVWNDFVHPTTGIPILLDNDWTNLFWSNRNQDKNIDAIYLTFMNRFFWKELFMARTEKNQGQQYVLSLGKGKHCDTEFSAREQCNHSYNLLNKDDGDYYADFEPYKFYYGEIPSHFFTHLRDVLNRYIKYNKAIPAQKWANDFVFIPKYEENKYSVTTLNQVQRVAFYAVCKYFEEGEADEITFSRWMRFVWNLISGEDDDGHPQIRSTEAMRGAMKRIESIKNSHKIYECLTQTKLQEGDSLSYLDLQWNEEVIKAKKIIDENGNLTNYDDEKTWEKIIIEAENWGFFKGSIRFLFTAADGTTCWDDFTTKWANIQRYFSQSSNKSAMGENYHSAKLLKALISRVKPELFWDVLNWHHRFSNKSALWLYYLLNPQISEVIHDLLMGNDTPKQLSKPSEDDGPERYIYLLSNTGLLDYIRKHEPNAWWIRKYHGHMAIYPSSTGVFLNSFKRDNFLLTYTTLNESCKIPNTDLLYGSDINFEYDGHHFQWYRNDTIYAMNDNSHDEYLARDLHRESEEEKYVCFSTSKLNDKEILDKIEELNQERQNI